MAIDPKRVVRRYPGHAVRDRCEVVGNVPVLKKQETEMLGLPVWLWVIFAIVGIPALAVWLIYSRFRKMCRSVREEIRRYVGENHPDLAIVGERQGDLVVRLPEGGERIWPMADVYVAVAKSARKGDAAARAEIYARALVRLRDPRPDRSQPLSLATHGPWIKPHLVTAEFYRQHAPASGAPHTPIPGLDGVVAIYVLDLADGPCYLSEQDRSRLGINEADMHRLALAHLRRDFPRQAVDDVLASGNPSALQLADSFNAARLLLLPECLAEHAELLALAPHADMLLLLPPATRKEPDKLEQALKTMECGNHRPLLDRPVRVTRNGFELI